MKRDKILIVSSVLLILLAIVTFIIQFYRASNLKEVVDFLLLPFTSNDLPIVIKILSFSRLLFIYYIIAGIVGILVNIKKR